MSEYGIEHPDEVTWKWTPAQIVVFGEAIRRRQAAVAAQYTDLIYSAALAAAAGKKGRSFIGKVIRRLRKAAGFGDPEDEVPLADRFAAILGAPVKPPDGILPPSRRPVPDVRYHAPEEGDGK